MKPIVSFFSPTVLPSPSSTPPSEVPRMSFSATHHCSGQNKAKLVVIMGATGAGKFRLSIDLSDHFPRSQIINSDKVQVYNGLVRYNDEQNLYGGEERGPTLPVGGLRLHRR
ncbi:hypothetical protein F3Y22_tig00110893pilonHSYRG00499 [Hibiscus syriacus]|uniref:Uncharacterized protein n=1 Tax=Hibiscus syriacus TaxID=106335 RepID=A0A6A2ZI17_HIBSY|nr:hypothetical protein F3Y22_tig00110893pilonHSYRG00499 [Hibiscus syriacus]